MNKAGVNYLNGMALHFIKLLILISLVILTDAPANGQSREKANRIVKNAQNPGQPANPSREQEALDDAEVNTHSAQTLYRAGKAYFEASNYTQALRNFMLSTRKTPYASAQNMIALMHRYGLGTPEDRIESLKWKHMSEATIKEGIQICNDWDVLQFAIPEQWLGLSRRTSLEIQDLSTEFTCDYTLSPDAVAEPGGWLVPDWALESKGLQQALQQRRSIDIAETALYNASRMVSGSRYVTVTPIGDNSYKLDYEYTFSKSTKVFYNKRRVAPDNSRRFIQQLAELQSVQSSLQIQKWLNKDSTNADKLRLWLFKMQISTSLISFSDLDQYAADREKFLRGIKEWK